ncbi:MAG TPA: 4-(cytidine 5'-diphospho)-2-C-methyl-D-erythritol kinase [Acidimicrobiales bacterium]|nr:4-(cytidine 5'-diphospho)-2-C-methyl-D-erythritol kinase [Acidimicrobiales bacterium]
MPSVAPPVVLIAPAKLTTRLRVVGRRDDGYHLLDAEMVSLDLADLLEVREADVSVVEVLDPTGAPIETGPVADNLVSRALALVGRLAHVKVTKRISPRAGLGGGSADAAAILRWAASDDLATAAQLGADVPFCLVGGRARVTGIGEVIEPLPFEARTFTLSTPPFGCSTVEVYRAWDRLGGPRDPRPDPANDLEVAALAVEPRLAEWRDRLGDAAGVEPRLAGSGSTWFVEGNFPGEGRVVAHALPAPA